MGITVTVLYDADCGFCTRSIRRLQAWGATGECRSLSSVDLAALGVDPARSLQEMPAVVDGEVVYGAPAVRALLSTGPRWMRGLARVMAVPPVSTLGDWVYRRVARNRHRLPGGTANCELP